MLNGAKIGILEVFLYFYCFPISRDTAEIQNLRIVFARFLKVSVRQGILNNLFIFFSNSFACCTGCPRNNLYLFWLQPGTGILVPLPTTMQFPCNLFLHSKRAFFGPSWALGLKKSPVDTDHFM